MKLAIYKNPEKQEDYIWSIDIKERYSELWYNEIMRRHKEDPDLPIYDIDEAMECWSMSTNHLRDMMDFLQLNK
jgi:hypothetical protein